MSKRDVQSKFSSIVEFAGLERFIDTPVKNFSSGMVVRLGFSIAAHVEPKILLIDEILSVGDQDFQRKSSEKIEEFRREGRTIVVVSHSLGLVQQLCKERGLLLIIDEVQTGFCRTGKWFGFEHAGISPDAVTMAKGMGNGMPVGALWARRDVASVLQPGDHGSTYSGTALATAAVSAVISEMKRLKADELAVCQGARLAKGLLAIPAIDSVRGSGLLLGAQLVEGLVAGDVYKQLLEKGLIVNAVNATTLRLAPPLTVSDAEIDEAVALIAEVLS